MLKYSILIFAMLLGQGRVGTEQNFVVTKVASPQKGGTAWEKDSVLKVCETGLFV